ncbi:MAG: NosD domain-containing protein [Candidatus Bathyarchaeota archaeon]|jgi:parallel beta-helix repeat protein
MQRREVFGLILLLLLVSVLTLPIHINPVEASGAVYIRSDGSIDPATAPIQREGDVYIFTDNIYDSLIVERNNIVVDGSGCTVQGTGSQTGIDLGYRSNVTLKNIEVTNFDYGVKLHHSNNNILVNNSACSNNFGGVFLTLSNDNIITGNSASNNRVGILLERSGNNVLNGNTVSLNDFSGITLTFSSTNRLTSNTAFLNNFDFGTYFFHVAGMYFYVSGNNTIISNTASNNHRGIFFVLSDNNVITGCNASNNNQEGVFLYYSSTNHLIGNLVSNNECGVCLENSSTNGFFHNNFIDNTKQVLKLFGRSANTWDAGYPSGGNYWSDHVAVDNYSGISQDEAGSDRIVDEPYLINEANKDSYPLVEPWNPKPSDPTEALGELIGTIGTLNLPKGTGNSLVAKLESARHLLASGNVNGAIHKLMDFIDQIEALLGKKLDEMQMDFLSKEAQRIIDLME